MMYQVFLKINLLIFSIDTQQTSQRRALNYLNIYAIIQNIKYLSEVLFFAAKVCQVMRNSTSLFKAKLRSKPLKMDNEVKLF